jgi:hypothetical protein
MAKDWTAALREVNFRCGECRHAWAGDPDLVEAAPEVEHHPHRYFANCPKCGAAHQPQAAWERALMKAHQRSTGPKTPEGIKAAAANVVGHPTAEESLRTRFNAMKHGLTARTATYFPAKPDRYNFCTQCDVNRSWCAEQTACVKQTEIFLLHHAAFQARDPKILSGLHSDLQAGLTATLQMLLQQALGDGVILRTPKVVLDKDGNSTTLTYLDGDGVRRYIYELQAHPALKVITEFVSRLGLSMADLGMTVRAADLEAESLPGRLSMDAQTQEALSSFGERMAATMAAAKDMLAKSAQLTREDPVLVEHEANEGRTG